MEWVKSIIENLKASLSLDFRRINSPDNRISTTTQIVNKNQSPQFQVGQLNVTAGLSYAEAKEMVTDLVDSLLQKKMIEVNQRAEQLYMQRLNEFRNTILEKLRELPASEIEKLEEPDTQISLVTAAKISGRKQGEEIREVLANLVVGRIKNYSKGQEELKNLVYNEAILTVEKITIDELKILSLCYLLKYTRRSGLRSWNDFNQYLNKDIKPFIDFKNTLAEFQHLEYTGAGILQITTSELTEIFRMAYSFLFHNLIPVDEIDRFNLPAQIKQKLFFPDAEFKRYAVPAQNSQELTNLLKENSLDLALQNQILSTYSFHIKNQQEVRKMISEQTDIGEALLGLWATSPLTRLSLTSVGIVIGATYFEQVTDSKVNMDIWIH